MKAIGRYPVAFFVLKDLLVLYLLICSWFFQAGLVVFPWVFSRPTYVGRLFHCSDTPISLQ